MKKRHIQLIILIVVFLAVFIAYRKTIRYEYITVGGLAQGTTYQITYESRKGEGLKKDIDSLLSGFDLSLSTYIDSSIISRINRNDSLAEVDDKFRKVFNKAYEVYSMTDGAFDITVGPVVNALGFGPEDAVDVDSALIDSLIAYVGMDKVSLLGSKLIKQEPDLMLDVNAIAQGYSVDIVAEYLNEKNIRHFMVEIGGEVRTKGRNPDNLIWRIGIDTPAEGNLTPGRELQAVIHLSNKSLATSGNYRRFYVKDGIKYVHTINPQTGYPVISNLLSATVIAKDCITADAYATAFMVMGLEKSVTFLNEHDFLEGYLIYSDSSGEFQIYRSEGLSQFIVE